MFIHSSATLFLTQKLKRERDRILTRMYVCLSSSYPPWSLFPSPCGSQLSSFFLFPFLPPSSLISSSSFSLSLSLSILSLPLALTARERGQVIPTHSFHFSHKWDNIVVEYRGMLNSPLETYTLYIFIVAYTFQFLSVSLFSIRSLSDLKRDLSFPL